jgi:ligand-binding SRPBCC domain-containing protein
MSKKPPQVIRISSALRATPEAVWQHASSFEGMNEELWPVQLGAPKGAVLRPDSARAEPLFRGAVSLLGVVVLDVHEFKLLRVSQGEGFHESSRSMLERRWEHVRSIASQPGGCVITDELEFEPRLLPVLVAAVVRRVFERRHAFLRRRFGELVVRG